MYLWACVKKHLQATGSPPSEHRALLSERLEQAMWFVSSMSPLKVGHGPVRTYLFLFENGEIGLPSARIRWKRSPKLMQKCVISRELSRVEIFEKDVLMLYSCGWMKTRPYRIKLPDDYVRVLDPNMCACSDQGWYPFTAIIAFSCGQHNLSRRIKKKPGKIISVFITTDTCERNLR